MLNRFTSALRSMGSQISLSSSQHGHFPANVSQRVKAREAFLFHGPKQSSVRMMASEGQIQSELMESMRMKIQDALDAEEVQVTDIQGDGRHVEIIVVSSQFEGKNSVNRQRMVYKVRRLMFGFCMAFTSDEKTHGWLHCSLAQSSESIKSSFDHSHLTKV